VGTFERLLGAHRTEVELRHGVRSDWLQRAQAEGLSTELRAEVARHLEEATARAAVVVCTCSTLGPVADDVASAHPSVFRIDRPMMEAAARCGGTCVVALCLDSTIGPTSELFEDVCRGLRRDPHYEIASCAKAWPHFEAGDLARFAAEIAATVRSRLAALPRAGSVVLAQASMAAAVPLLADAPVPILSSPKLAAEEALRRAR